MDVTYRHPKARAVQWTGDNPDELRDFTKARIRQELDWGQSITLVWLSKESPRLNVGDWIVIREDGTLLISRSRKFERDYSID